LGLRGVDQLYFSDGRSAWMVVKAAWMVAIIDSLKRLERKLLCAGSEEKSTPQLCLGSLRHVSPLFHRLVSH
jgi:hypothetical protein